MTHRDTIGMWLRHFGMARTASGAHCGYGLRGLHIVLPFATTRGIDQCMWLSLCRSCNMQALAPLRALSLLSQYAHSSTLHTDAPGGGGSSTGQQDAKSAAAHAAGQRAQGLQMLKAAMWGCGDAERLELVGRARPNLTAAELVRDGSGSNDYVVDVCGSGRARVCWW